MPWPYSDIVEQNHRVGSGSASFVYTVSRAIVVKAVRSEVSEWQDTPFSWTKTYECFNKRGD
jgi:hypothetical protein